MFLASPDGEKALCPCRLPLGEVFWGALPVLVLRVALTHIAFCWVLDGGCLGWTQPWGSQCHQRLFRRDHASHRCCSPVSSFNFPTSWREGRLGNIRKALQCWEEPWKCKISHADSKLIFHQIYLRIELLINDDSPHTDKWTNPISVLLSKNEIHTQYLQNNK